MGQPASIKKTLENHCLKEGDLARAAVLILRGALAFSWQPPSVKEEPAEAEGHSNNNNNTEEEEGACPAAAEAPPPQADAEMIQVKEEPMEVATAQVNGEQQDQAAVKTEQGSGDAPTQGEWAATGRNRLPLGTIFPTSPARGHRGAQAGHVSSVVVRLGLVFSLSECWCSIRVPICAHAGLLWL